MSLKTSFVFQALDRVSAPVRKIGAGIVAMTTRAVAGFRKTGDAGKSAAKAVLTIETMARRVSVALRALENNRGLKALKHYAEAGGKALGFAARKAAELGKWAGAALGAGIVALGFGVFKTGIQYENFMTQLETSEGSIAKARGAFAWVKKFAAQTPYELTQVMESFIKLRAYGIDPTDGTLRTLGDTAAGMGKDVMMAVEAMADAMTGEFERLKEFGIKAKVQGDKVRFAYTVNNKAMVVSAKNSGVEIQRALRGIWDSRFAGGMARQSKNLGGILSNLSDWWSDFKNQIGNAGVFDYVKGKVGGFLASLQTPAGAAKASALAKNISDGMIKGLKILEKAFANFDIGKFVADLASLVSAAAGVVKFFGGIGGAINALVVGGIANFGYIIGSIAVAIGAAFGIAAAPIALTVAAITGVIAVAFLLWRNWANIKTWFIASWGEMTAAIGVQAGKWSALFSDMWTKSKAAFMAGAAAIWNAMPSWLRAVIKGTVFLLKVANPVAAAQAVARAAAPPAAVAPAQVGRGGTPRAAAAQVGGRIDLHVSSDGKPSVRKVAATNSAVPIDVYRGITGGAFA